MTQESSGEKAKKFIEERLSESWNDFSDEERESMLSEIEEWFRNLEERRDQTRDPNLGDSNRGVTTSVKTLTDEQLTIEFLSHYEMAHAVNRPSKKVLLWIAHIAKELENRSTISRGIENR